MNSSFPKPDFEGGKKAWLSGQDQALWAWALSDLISSGVPILECFRICANAFSHPRLGILNFEVHNAIREGSSMLDGMNSEYLRGAIDPYMLDMVDVGEETGDLDQTLRRFACSWLETSHRSLATALGRDPRLSYFTEQLGLLQEAGLPLLRSLQMLNERPSLAGAKPAMEKLVEQIEGGTSLGEAFAALTAQELPVDPLYLAMIRTGEVGGVMDIILGRLAQQDKPLRS